MHPGVSVIHYQVFVMDYQVFQLPCLFKVLFLAFLVSGGFGMFLLRKQGWWNGRICEPLLPLTLEYFEIDNQILNIDLLFRRGKIGRQKKHQSGMCVFNIIVRVQHVFLENKTKGVAKFGQTKQKTLLVMIRVGIPYMWKIGIFSVPLNFLR